jgi:hypothetical protein
LRRDPARPDLHLRLARALYLSVAAEALYEYQLVFPNAFLDGTACETQYDAWRRGWFAHDRDGSLRRALTHARRAAAAGTPDALRVTALQLMATIYRESGRDSRALAPLLVARQIDPDNGPTRVMLGEVRRRLAERRPAPTSYPRPQRRPPADDRGFTRL